MTPKRRLPKIRHVLAVASGKGGVGKTTVTVNLALALHALGASVGIFDADIFGPNVPLMLGVHRHKPGHGYVPTARRKDARPYIQPLERFGLKIMSMGLIVAEDQVINPLAEVAGQVVVETLRSVEWDALDYLLLDLPPSAGQPQQGLLESLALDGVLVVTTPQDLSLLDSARSLLRYAQAGVPILGLVENMSYFICPSCGERHEIFQHSAQWRPEALQAVPVLGRIPLAAEISRGIDRTHPLMAGPSGRARPRGRRATAPQAKAFIDHCAERCGTNSARQRILPAATRAGTSGDAVMATKHRLNRVPVRRPGRAHVRGRLRRSALPAATAPAVPRRPPPADRSTRRLPLDASEEFQWSVEIVQDGQPLAATADEVQLPRAPFTIRVQMPQPLPVKLNALNTDANFQALQPGFALTNDCTLALCTGMDVAEDRLNPERDLFVDPQLTHYLYYQGPQDHRWSRADVTATRARCSTATWLRSMASRSSSTQTRPCTCCSSSTTPTPARSIRASSRRSRSCSSGGAPECPESNLPKTYDFAATEQRLYAWWESNGWFKPRNDPNQPGFDPTQKPFVISIPPPNVTGELHLGHAMFVAVEDLMIRYHRMRGEPTLWVPGSDHAGIATQLQVEKELLRTEEVTREELGREAFVARTWEWKRKYGSIIYDQLRRLGASVDWSRERFTLDEGLSRAVREAFVRLYEKGLIYRGPRLINWSPGLKTAVSDLEVEYSEEPGTLYYFRYPLVGSEEYIPVATTRPETILGDTAVAVHPDDERYQHLIGRTALVPMLNREIPVIADEAVSREFGTGALKITPGHDPTDYEIGARHSLPIISMLDREARVTAAGGPYQGLDRFECRKKLWADMQPAGLTIKTEPYLTTCPARSAAARSSSR